MQAQKKRATQALKLRLKATVESKLNNKRDNSKTNYHNIDESKGWVRSPSIQPYFEQILESRDLTSQDY